jgi:hypothetical protein
MFVVALRRWAYNLSGFNKYGKSEIKEMMFGWHVHCIGDFGTKCGRVLTVVCKYPRSPIVKYLETQPNLQIQLPTVLTIQREGRIAALIALKYSAVLVAGTVS